MGPIDRPPAHTERTQHLLDVLDEMPDSALAERLDGFRQMLGDLPADDDAMRPLVQILADTLDLELRIRTYLRDRRN